MTAPFLNKLNCFELWALDITLSRQAFYPPVCHLEVMTLAILVTHSLDCPTPDSFDYVRRAFHCPQPVSDTVSERVDHEALWRSGL